MKLSFWFAKSKPKGHGIIKLSVIIDDVESFITTGIRIEKSCWGGNSIRIIGDSPKFREYKRIISNYENRAYEAKPFFKQADLTATRIVAFLNFLVKKNLLDQEVMFETVDEFLKGGQKKKKPEPTITELFAWFRSVNPCDEGTLSSYNSREKNISLYLQHIKRPKMFPSEFGMIHARNLYDFLRLDNELSKNYSIRTVYHLRYIFETATAKGVIENNPIAKFEEKRQKKKDLRHLTPAQLTRLQTLDFRHMEQTKREKLQKVRDIFLFLCYTGLHIGDYFSLKKEDFYCDDRGIWWMIRLRNKTGEEHLSEIKQKMHLVPLQLISKYNGIDRKYEKVGRKLMQVSGLPYISDVEVNRELKVIEQMIGGVMGLSSKIGRKTFAWMCLNRWGYDLETTATMMGCEVDNISQYAEVDFERIDKKVKWQEY